MRSRSSEQMTLWYSIRFALRRIPLTVAGAFAATTGTTSGIVDSQPLQAFATSTIGTGDLHSWSEVVDTNLSGLFAGDGICQARATSAGLTNPSNYIAWLSDRNNDAYCRIFGLPGKKAENCGLPTLPVGAGPWVRVDDVPFAGKIENALGENVVYSPLNVDEYGNPFYSWAVSFTATDNTGVFNTIFENDADCDEWTSASADPNAPFPTLGSNLSSSEDWTFNGSGVSCNGHRRLMCLQRKSGPPLSGHARFGHREAFVTSTNVTGDLGGIAGADTICRSLATSAGLHQAESFKALLASTALGVNATDRLVFDGPWYRRDGLQFASGKAELTSGIVTLPLNVTEAGRYVGWAVAWTGSNEDGSPSSYSCQDWTTTTGFAFASPVFAVAFAYSGGDWLDTAMISCAGPEQADSWPTRVYCLSDSDVLFYDRFETLPDSP